MNQRSRLPLDAAHLAVVRRRRHVGDVARDADAARHGLDRRPRARDRGRAAESVLVHVARGARSRAGCRRPAAAACRSAGSRDVVPVGRVAREVVGQQGGVGAAPGRPSRRTPTCSSARSDSAARAPSRAPCRRPGSRCSGRSRRRAGRGSRSGRSRLPSCLSRAAPDDGSSGRAGRRSRRRRCERAGSLRSRTVRLKSPSAGTS